MTPIVKPELMHEYARRLAGEIDKRGAKTVFYLIWSREHTPETQAGLDANQAKRLQTIAWRSVRPVESARP